MLDKTSKKILKHAISNYTGNMEKDILIFPNELELDYTEINAACLHLKSLGYISDFIPSYFSDDAITLHLSHNGLQYFKNRFNWFYKNWLEILTLTVSIATLIVTAIK